MNFEDWYNDENNAKGIKEALESINNTSKEIDNMLSDMEKSIARRRKKLEELRSR